MTAANPRWCWSAALLGVALLAGCGTQVVNPVTGQVERTVMDERRELAEGKKAHEEVLKQYGAYNDPKLQAYVNNVGQKLAAQSHRANIAWTFTVLDSPEINAFALPGGYVYVTRGILAYMESEADMAGVIGHEIGHVTARHGAQRATRQQNAGWGVLAATVFGAALEVAGVGGATQLAGQAAQGVAAGYVASYSRDQELQADTLGAEYLARSRYAPSNMVDVIQVLKSQEQFTADQARAEGRPAASGNGWLASHPSNEERLRAIRQNATKYAGDFGDDGRERYLAMVNGMRFGESPEQGLTRGQNFYHPALGIALTAPPGWRIQNEADAVTLINPEANAALKVIAAPSEAGSTHQAVLKNGLRAGQGQSTTRTVNGLPATHFSGLRQVPSGQNQTLEATIVTGPEQKLYALVYLGADAATLQRAMPALKQAENGFRSMTNADRQAARPWVLRVQTLPTGGLAALQSQSPLSDRTLRPLQLLNGVYGSGEPKPGQQVKVVAVQ